MIIKDNRDCCTVIGIRTVVEKIQYQKKRIVTSVLARYMLEAGNESKQPQILGMMLWVEMEADMGMLFGDHDSDHQLLLREDARRRGLGPLWWMTYTDRVGHQKCNEGDE